MKELIKAIQDLIAGTYASANAALKNLPPVEQHEANQEVAFCLRCMRGFGAEMIEQLKQLDQKLTSQVESAFAAAQKAALDDAVKAGEFLRKADHEAAINAAREGAERAVTEQLTAKFEAQMKAAAKRAEITKDLPTVVAEKISDEVLLGADADKTLSVIKDRLKQLAEMGSSVENSAAFVAEVATLPVDEAGAKAFDARVAPVKAVYEAASKKTGGNPPNPAAGLGAKPADTDSNRFL